MSWDDEDFDVPTATPRAGASWEEEAEDDPVVDSWDVDEDELARQKKEADEKKKAELKKKQDEAKAKKAAAKLGKQALLEIDTVDEATRREMLRKAELLADLNNAADLFGGLGVAKDNLEDELIAHPREKLAAPAKKAPAFNKDTPLTEHPLFQPTNKQEFEKLRKTVGSALTGLADDALLNYSSLLAVDLIRDLVQPLSVENVRKVISTLTVIQREKERQERQARLQKSGGTATGGAGKKKAKPAVKTNVNNPGFKKDSFDDMGGDYDDFGDDDFM
ncbi:translation initiation factor 3 subunit 1 eIF-3 s1 [Metschnikowia aff. pulcherrima]|uniref:Eukaryotic translation initiation factor 3 subunit J n=1 Tax=Metschnikowia aff. pulcherrima TaxID=2163413 RepID=A0A4P6XUV9_9ASCO|nr:translation initiation factor 3 subunit 1 eIF-3 s1 [Metschnikowia aff. pulcherrima]